MLRRKLLQIPAALFASPGDRRLLAELTETIIPADAHSPGAKGARVAEYIEQVLASTVDGEQRRLWKDGLAAIDRKAFLDGGPARRVALMEEIAKKSPRFFQDLKRLTIAGYYTSRIGILEELEYKGNRIRQDFAGCADE